MKVSELIEMLSNANPDALVLVRSHNPELMGATVDVRGFHTEKITKKVERFRDMMDYSTFSTEVYRPKPDEGDPAIVIYG